MDTETSNGWDGIADQFIEIRSDIGRALVRTWARDNFQKGDRIIDVGCGSGYPIINDLLESGFDVFGIDASAKMIEACRQQFPGVMVACETAQSSTFFNQRFDAAVSIGLIFLLPRASQRLLINKIAAALKPNGRFLFTAPYQRSHWLDNLTKRRSRSLGHAAYEKLLNEAGIDLMGTHVDEGENHYFDGIKRQQ